MAKDAGFPGGAAMPYDAGAASPELHHEIAQFLYYEARLLDDRRWDDWYALLADDIHYLMPTRYNRLRREAAHEFAAPGEAYHFDETRHSLGQRIKRLKSTTAWAEDPPSRTRHFVSNVIVRATAKSDEYEVQCYYLLYRARLEREVETFAGMRQDLLRRSDAQARWLIARRAIVLDQTVVLARNMSFFF
ncbi:MAG TPA: 3-phenylpropionate/cinnamic acid dioxygenase subunit beta [Candidatus Binataceae bacterium]|jgi:3-phenylpropionate/cinnamic acid dioxygenase small subunit|nr:3-phenylpropionate/cinnamic acid dioxygenase subunit beta [Candidatus Binataceae bacterium]